MYFLVDLVLKYLTFVCYYYSKPVGCYDSVVTCLHPSILFLISSLYSRVCHVTAFRSVPPSLVPGLYAITAISALSTPLSAPRQVPSVNSPSLSFHTIPVGSPSFPQGPLCSIGYLGFHRVPFLPSGFRSSFC